MFHLLKLNLLFAREIKKRGVPSGIPSSSPLTWTFSMTVRWYPANLRLRVSLSPGAMHGFRAASFHRETSSSHIEAQAFWEACNYRGRTFFSNRV